MKTYEQLNTREQVWAVSQATTGVLTAICEHGIRFNDSLNGNDLQERIDTAWDKAEAMQTPWYWHEYILDTCREDIESMARAQAENAIYFEPDESNKYVMYLPREGKSL